MIKVELHCLTVNRLSGMSINVEMQSYFAPSTLNLKTTYYVIEIEEEIQTLIDYRSQRATILSFEYFLRVFFEIQINSLEARISMNSQTPLRFHLITWFMASSSLWGISIEC